MSKSLQIFHGPIEVSSPHPIRAKFATLLRQTSRGLSRFARRISASSASINVQRPPELEFYADAGAPEGALYVNGDLVGTLPGVSRL